MNSRVELRWGAWNGDRLLTITFPSSWDVAVLGNEYAEGLSHENIGEKLRHPSGSRPLKAIAKGRHRAAIVVDDITRPTPTAAILPHIIGELESGGMHRNRISIVIGSGAHGKASQEDMISKVGEGIFRDVPVIAHDSEQDLIFLGKSSKGTPIYVNRFVMSCDLKIGIGSIIPHPIASFSGGSKIIAPGICGSETTRYLHDYTNDIHLDYLSIDHERMERRGGSLDNDFRREIDAIADKVGLDFIVNVVLNHKREISRVFAGSRTAAYQHGVKEAYSMFRITPEDSADIVISNTYPFDMNLWHMQRGFWPLLGRGNGTSKVVIGFGARTLASTSWKSNVVSRLSRRFNRMKYLRPSLLRHEFRIAKGILQRFVNQRRLECLFFCPGLTDRELLAVFPRSKRFSIWDDLLAELQRRHGQEKVKVAVYPHSPLQVPSRTVEMR